MSCKTFHRIVALLLLVNLLLYVWVSQLDRFSNSGDARIVTAAIFLIMFLLALNEANKE